MNEQVKVIKKGFAANVWTLRHLKRVGIPNDKLTRIFQSYIRPIIEYASVVYDSMLTKTQSDAIERLQSNALKTIWGWDKSYEWCIENGAIERLDERREKAVIKFANKTLQNPRYENWFPLNDNTHHDLRRREKFHIDFARHERLKRAPIYAMRRKLNEMASTEENAETAYNNIPQGNGIQVT